MVQAFDFECDLPTAEAYEFRARPGDRAPRGSGDTFRGREGDLDGDRGGMANYVNIFGPGYAEQVGMTAAEFADRRRTMGAEDLMAELRRRLGERAMPIEEFVAYLERVGVKYAALGTSQQPSNDYVADLVAAYPDRFVGFVRVSPWDGMAAVREFERLIRDRNMKGLAMASFREQIPPNDRRYYPLYTKCVELNVPVRLYSSMSYATDRPYDLGHPRALDDVCCDFPELTVIAGLGGWPWINEMVALLRRHPNLYVDFAAHRPRHLGTPGSGWEMLLQFGNTLLQDKVLWGASWLTIGQPYETLIDEVLALPLKDGVREKWLYKNAVRVMGMD